MYNDICNADTIAPSGAGSERKMKTYKSLSRKQAEKVLSRNHVWWKNYIDLAAIAKDNNKAAEIRDAAQSLMQHIMR